MMTSGFADHVRGEVKSGVEKEKTDRLRERRKKKLLQGKRQKERELVEKAVDKANPGLGNKHAKLRTIRQLQKAEKEGTVTLVIYLNVFLSFPFFSWLLGSFLCQRPLLILGYGRSGCLAFRSAVNVTDLTKVAFFFSLLFSCHVRRLAVDRSKTTKIQASNRQRLSSIDCKRRFPLKSEL
jgi:hypothetical protein